MNLPTIVYEATPRATIVMMKRCVTSKNSDSFAGRTRVTERLVAFDLPASSLNVKSVRFGSTLETLDQMKRRVPVAELTADSPAVLSDSIAPRILSTAS